MMFGLILSFDQLMAKTDSSRLAVHVNVTDAVPSFVNEISADPEAFTSSFSPLVNE